MSPVPERYIPWNAKTRHQIKKDRMNYRTWCIENDISQESSDTDHSSWSTISNVTASDTQDGGTSDQVAELGSTGAPPAGSGATQAQLDMLTCFPGTSVDREAFMLGSMHECFKRIRTWSQSVNVMKHRIARKFTPSTKGNSRTLCTAAINIAGCIALQAENRLHITESKRIEQKLTLAAYQPAQHTT